ncbi:MAG: hypothetical protein VW945_07780 [Candidatus Poseidoniales archaeon]
MPPIWPFKKKKEMEHEIDEAPPAPVVYKRGEDPNARAAVEADAGAYKDALALFGDGSSAVNAATDQSVHYDGVTASGNESVPAQSVNSGRPDGSSSEEKSTDVEAVAATSPTWVHHTDGYHYKQHADGSFEPTPHVKQADGSYEPYS